MDYLAHKRVNRQRRAQRTRASISGATNIPRLSVHISNLHITAQLVDDAKGVTLAYATTIGQKVSGNMNDKAAWVGSQIAATAKKAKITKVVFDRGSRAYHGRVKTLADAARSGGLEF